MKPTQFRFAPLIRVSTEGQEAKGGSLRTQKKQIIQYVKNRGGVIPDQCWQYSGQEHATPEHERRKLDQLLTDSSKGRFDAVIVCDNSRWSRDNAKSKKGLEIFKKNGIRFFVGSIEYDLFNPEQAFILGMTTEVNEYLAQIQTQKSVLNKIEMLRQGKPVSGKKPPGRTYDKGEWGIDKAYQRKIERAADQFLKGTSLKTCADRVGTTLSNLRKTLLYRSGDTYTVTFNVPRFQIHETITIENIPRLLPEETIDAVKAKLQTNKTIFHGYSKHKYLLSRAILCGHCGGTLFGETRRGKQHYVHKKKTDCTHFRYVSAAIIENPVLVHLFGFFGNQAAMEEAIQAAIPDYSETDKMETRKAEIEQELRKIETAKNRLFDIIEESETLPNDIKGRLTKHRERESLLNKELEGINSKLRNIPSQKAIGMTADLLRREIESKYSSGLEFAEMNFDERRKLVQLAFSGGTDQDGNRAGVYILKDNEGYSIEIKGVIPGTAIKDYLPMDPEKANILLGIEDDNCNPFVKSEQESLSSDKGHTGGKPSGNPFGQA